jgi:hypothetical protein
MKAARFLVAAATAAFLVGGSGAWAPGDTALAKGPRVTTPDEAKDADLRAIAEANGWTLDQARAQERSTEALDRVIGELVETHPGILVGSALSEDPEGAPTIYLKGPLTPEVEAIIAAAGVPITIVADQPYSFEELEDRSIRAHRAVWDLGIPFVHTGSDLADGARIPMMIARNGGFSDADLAAIIAALPEDVRADVDLTVVDPPIDALLCPPVARVPSPGAALVASPAPSASSAPAVPCLDVPPGWGPLAVVDDPALGGLDAGIGPGRIRITDDCVILRGKRGPGVTLVWRAGDTRWDPATGEILFADRDDGLLRLGDGVRVTLGGYSPEPGEEGPRMAPWLAEPDASCPAEQWMVHDVSIR